MRAATQQTLPVEKRNVAVLQLFVMAAEAVCFNNRRHALIEKTPVVSLRPEKEQDQRKHCLLFHADAELIAHTNYLAVRNNDIQQLFALHLTAGFIGQRGNNFLGRDIDHFAG